MKAITIEIRTSKIDVACTCGSTMFCIAPPITVEMLKRIWQEKHSGPGHAPAESKDLRQKNRRTEK